MDIKLLEDFVCLVKFQNFTAAARERTVTQSAFSRRIKALEEWLGTPLINREHKLFELTPQGSLFIKEAEAVLLHLYNARKAMRATDSSSEIVITIAAQNSIAQSFFIDWAKRLEVSMSSVCIRLSSEKLIDCVELFSKGSVDYMLCFYNDLASLVIDEKQFNYITVGKEILVPVSVPLKAHSKEPTFTLPGNAENPVPFVAYTHNSTFGKAVDQAIQDKDHCCFLDRRYENDFSHILKSMATERLGFAWLPKSLVLSDLENGKLCRAGDKRWDIEFDIRLYYHTSGSIHEKDILKTSLKMAEELLR